MESINNVDWLIDIYMERVERCGEIEVDSESIR